MGTPGDDNDLLCVNGLQHAFAVTAWEQSGADGYTFWTTELMCPTCGTTANRTPNSGDWTWNAPE